MKVKLYDLLTDKIEEGLRWGLQRAYKYDDAPKTEAQMLAELDNILTEIKGAICTYLDFDDEREV